MNRQIELPADVIAELRANRKVSAIRKLRGHRGIGLKEAKELVEAYEALPPATATATATRRPPETDTGVGRVVLLIIGVTAIFALYKFLS
jgi:Ribosomal protein L7/L12 C-terminal domain